MNQLKREQRRLRQIELLKNFTGDYYQEKQVGDKWLVKHLDGDTGKWQVAEYTEDSFSRYKQYSSALNEVDDEFYYLMDKDE